MHIPISPHGHTVFCDDVRQEVGNKITLVGVYSGTMEFSEDVQFPLIIPRLCIGIFWTEAADTSVKEIAFRVTLAELDADPHSDDGILLAESIANVGEAKFVNMPDEQTLLRLRGAAVKNITSFVILSPLPLAGPGKIRVRAFRDGEPWMAGSLRIIKPSDHTSPE
jgi:hypothetical protein